jgi:hypothetical protein
VVEGYVVRPAAHRAPGAAADGGEGRGQGPATMRAEPTGGLVNLKKPVFLSLTSSGLRFQIPTPRPLLPANLAGPCQNMGFNTSHMNL